MWDWYVSRECRGSRAIGLGSFGIMVVLEVKRSYRADGGYAQFILTFTPMLGIGWFVASHVLVASHRYGFPLENELVL